MAPKYRPKTVSYFSHVCGITSSHLEVRLSACLGARRVSRFHQSVSEPPIQNVAPFDPFEYQNLNANEIRLLRIDRKNGSYPQFSIQHFSRDKAPQYAALSYVWSEAPELDTISLGGRTFKVRPNLYSCLNFLLAREDITYLWIDAICTDQTNVLEKNEQVRRLNQTYRNASIVLAWLGWVGYAEEEIEPVRVIETIRPVSFSRKTSHDHPYWSRMWTTLEVFLARKIEMISPGEGSRVVDDPGSRWDISSLEERFRPGSKL